MTLSIFLSALVAATLALSAIMYVAWTVEQRSGNAGWVDTFWSFGVGAVSVVGALAALVAGGGMRTVLVAALCAIWSLRLGSHILRRTRAAHDDPRYAGLRAQWGPQAPARMFWFLQIQAAVSIPLAMSVILAAWNPIPGLRAQDILAIVVLATAVAGEGLADRQVRHFRADPANRGKICTAGLWGWSRHPNYFFEWLGWAAYPLFAVDFGGVYAWGWLALSAPLCMYWLLNKVSGIPPLEDIMIKKYGRAYEDYRLATSPFFPLPPRARTRMLP